MSIVVENVSKKYDSHLVLNNVSFGIKSGEIVGFIGPNGAGKTTMMRIICGIIAPDEGNVKIKNLDVIDNSVDVKRLIGYLPENNPLYKDLFISEYLQYLSGIYNLGREAGSRIRETIALTGLESEINKKIGELSKGFSQRVGLAQAILHNPDVLILDEPTSGLDPNQIIEIRNLIYELGKKKTILLSTHIMQEVEAICDRVLIINNGEIIADDKAENIQSYGKITSYTILVEFNEPVDESSLLTISGIEKVKPVNNYTWLIQTAHSKDIRSDIFKFAVNNNLTVLSLQKKDKSLEEVFHELTN
ncbi:MAG: ATP-binding cassette domain-containing protein [Bacteroidales bacterium]|nr:MAG: ATP-binding cassette domain-containing protein [Bacteroidales bacterium]